MPGPDIVRRNFRQYDKDNKQAGIYTPTTPGWAWATVAAVASQGRVGRFVPSRNMTIVNITFVVAVASSIDDPVDVGIYDASFAKLVSSGATLGKLNSTGTKTIAVAATTLQANTIYYAALSFGTVGGTAASLAAANLGSGFYVSAFGATAGLLEASQMTAAHPLPTTFVNNTGPSAAWVLALKET